MAVPNPPPPNARSHIKRDAAFYRALGEECFKMGRRMIEIAGEIQNAGELIGE